MMNILGINLSTYQDNKLFGLVGLTFVMYVVYRSYLMSERGKSGQRKVPYHLTDGVMLA